MSGDKNGNAKRKREEYSCVGCGYPVMIGEKDIVRCPWCGTTMWLAGTFDGGFRDPDKEICQ